MQQHTTSGRSRILASLTCDLGRPLFRARDREWTAGMILSAAERLRATFTATDGPVGVAFAQQGPILAALLAGWSLGRRMLLIDPSLKREADVVRRNVPGIRIYSDRPNSDDRIDVSDALAKVVPMAAPPGWLSLPADDVPFASLLTSASTGENKVIEKLGFQMYRQAEALSSVLAMPDRGRVLSFVPPYHLLGFFYGLVLPLVQGAETVADGGFRLLGRLDHVVKVGGKRFSTVEVEQVLRTMPGVAEVAVFPYTRFGEPALAAAVSPEPGTSLDQLAIRSFLVERLASYKLPRSIAVLARLPHGSHDKIDYRALRAEIAEGEGRRG
jgi:acyl-coenzyme A synthetase/AMP-(fatty) acid ligase